MVLQIQKFALRFSTIYEADRFINALKVKPMGLYNIDNHHNFLKPMATLGLQFFSSFSCTDGVMLFFLFQEILKDMRDIPPLNSDYGSEIVSQSEFMSSNTHPDR